MSSCLANEPPRILFGFSDNGRFRVFQSSLRKLSRLLLLLSFYQKSDQQQPQPIIFIVRSKKLALLCFVHKRQTVVVADKNKRKVFLAPTGAQGVKMCVCASVRASVILCSRVKKGPKGDLKRGPKEIT